MTQAIMTKKASPATHDALVVLLARDHELLLDVLHQACPIVFSGVGEPKISVVEIEHAITVSEEANSKNNGNRVAGFIDLAVGVQMTRTMTVLGMRPPMTTTQTIRETFYIEVKSGRILLGDLLRQIARYRTHRTNGHWIVVSPDCRYADLLRAHDIAFVRMTVPEMALR